MTKERLEMGKKGDVMERENLCFQFSYTSRRNYYQTS